MSTQNITVSVNRGDNANVGPGSNPANGGLDMGNPATAPAAGILTSGYPPTIAIGDRAVDNADNKAAMAQQLQNQSLSQKSGVHNNVPMHLSSGIVDSNAAGLHQPLMPQGLPNQHVNMIMQNQQQFHPSGHIMVNQKQQYLPGQLMGDQLNQSALVNAGSNQMHGVENNRSIRSVNSRKSQRSTYS